MPGLWERTRAAFHQIRFSSCLLSVIFAAVIEM